MLEWRKRLLVGLVFFALFIIRYYIVLPPRYIATDDLVGEEISFSGIIITEPDERDLNTKYLVRVPGFQNHNVLITADRFPEHYYGDLIRVLGTIEFPREFETDLGRSFDYPSYLAKDKIRYVSYRPHIMVLEQNRGSKFFSLLYKIKDGFVRNIQNSLPEPASSLGLGVTLGVKQSLGQELLDTFRSAGIIHIVVLSGYNMTIIAAGALFILSRFRFLPRGFVLSSAALLMLGFATLVGFSATVLRATIMALLAVLARFLGRPIMAMRTLFIAGAAMLLWNPLILFYDPSFQLSFLATFGLIALSPILEKYLNLDVWLAKIWVPASAKRSVVGEIFIATLSTQLFVLPALIYMTGQFSIVSLPTNLLVLPLVPLAMIFTGLAGLLGFIPLISKIVAFPAYFVLSFIIKTSSVLSNLPLAVIELPRIPLSIILGIYFLATVKLLSITFQFKFRKKSST